MKISCLRSDLATAISNVSRAVSTKASIPALEGVLIKAYGNTLNISGYNLEIGITTDIEATIKEEGEIVVSAKLFLILYADFPKRLSLSKPMSVWLHTLPAERLITRLSVCHLLNIPTFRHLNRLTELLSMQKFCVI